MDINKVFYFFIFLNYISGQGFGESAVSFSKKCLKAKSTYILPLFLASNFYFFTQKKHIVRKIDTSIYNYKLSKLSKLSKLNENEKTCFEKFNQEYVALNRMMGKSFFSYIFSVFYFSKISYVNLGKEWGCLSLNENKIRLLYNYFCPYYSSYDNEKSWRCTLELKKSKYYTNELMSNFLGKFFLDFLILSCYLYPKLCKSISLSFGLHINLFLNFFIQMIQENHANFLTKLFLINKRGKDIEELIKNEENSEKSILDSEKKKLRENIFYQNLFIIPMFNEFALAHYSLKNYPSHLICFLGFCLLVLSNHFFSHSVASRFFKNSLHKLLFNLPLLFFDLFIFYHYLLEYQKLKKQKEEKNQLKPGESITLYYQEEDKLRIVTEVCDSNGKITKTTEYFPPT